MSERFPNMNTSFIEEQLFGKLPMTEEEQEDEIGRREERYEKMCIEMDEGQPNDNDSGWE